MAGKLSPSLSAQLILFGRSIVGFRYTVTEVNLTDLSIVLRPMLIASQFRATYPTKIMIDVLNIA